MVVKAMSFRVEEIVDRFELNWDASSRAQIPGLLAQADLSRDAGVATELARVDIQRRYAAKLPVDLRPYLNLLQAIDENTSYVIAIAYEDFRTRRANAEPCPPERWQGISGVEMQPWYKSLIESAQRPNQAFVAIAQAEPQDARQAPSVEMAAETAIESAGFTPMQQIGRGEFSRVFLARQESLANRYVVIKAVLRSFDEANRLAELQHTNIVPIYSFHRCGPWSLLCMPYAGSVTFADYFNAVPDSTQRSGQSLITTIQVAREATVGLTQSAENAEQQPIGISETNTNMEVISKSIMPLPRNELGLWLFSRVADALQHAHVRGIIHGDIKPANLLIRNDGEPALLDFNLSQKLVHSEISAIGGTLSYMAPESLRSLLGLNSWISFQSDIYSLGMVLYQFVTGRNAYPPLRSAASIDLELAINQRQSAVTWQDADRVTPAIRAIVEKCLAPLATDRYASADQLRDDLECERHNLPLRYAKERSLRHRTHKWIARHPRVTSVAWVTAASVAIFVMMGVAFLRVSESRENLAAMQVFQEFEADAKGALADLMFVGRTNQTQTLRRASECLSTYQVLNNENWQKNAAWQRLDNGDKETALSLMASLMLRIAWNHLGDAALAAVSNPIRIRENADLASQAAEKLAQPPFDSMAPLAIKFLSQEFGQVNDEQRPERFITSTELIQAASLSPLDRMALAMKYIEQGNGLAATKLLPASLLRQIDEYFYWITLGRAQMMSSDLRAAELSFSMALENHPVSAAAFHYRGVCRMRMRNEQDTRKAVEDFTSSLKFQPDANDSLLNRAMACEVIGDLQQAINDLDSLIARNPNEIRAMTIKSRLLRRKGDLAGAAQVLEAALQGRPSTVSDWTSRALTRLAFDKQGALNDLQQARKLAPFSVDVLQNLAHVYSEHFRDNQSAIACLDQLLDINPEFEPALLGRSVLHARCGHVDEAIADLDFAIASHRELTPSSMYQAACMFAQILTRRDDLQQAERWKQKAFAYLANAIQQGYGAELIETDEDLVPIKDDARFVGIITMVRAGQNLNRLK